MSEVKLVSLTKPIGHELATAEELIAYCARVSNPSNQLNKDTSDKLIRFLVKNKHWSPFEMVSMCVLIKTSRAIAAQILRHRSFSFQEFSQRYSSVSQYESVELRYAAETNRQSSTDVTKDEILNKRLDDAIHKSFEVYNDLLEKGVATETARMVLPLCTTTTLYMSGTIRSWIHYLQIRCDEHVQKEHRIIAESIMQIFKQQFPNVYEGVFENE